VALGRRWPRGPAGRAARTSTGMAVTCAGEVHPRRAAERVERIGVPEVHTDGSWAVPVEDGLRPRGDLLDGLLPRHRDEGLADALMRLPDAVGVEVEVGGPDALAAGEAPRDRVIVVRSHPDESPVLDGRHEAAAGLAEPAERADPLGRDAHAPPRVPGGRCGTYAMVRGNLSSDRASSGRDQLTRPSHARASRTTSEKGLFESKLGSRGRPRTRSAMPLRIISLVPAAIELMRPFR
jgi:hypothetical protein